VKDFRNSVNAPVSATSLEATVALQADTTAVCDEIEPANNSLSLRLIRLSREVSVTVPEPSTVGVTAMDLASVRPSEDVAVTEIWYSKEMSNANAGIVSTGPVEFCEMPQSDP
jgi:hypothetical protein